MKHDIELGKLLDGDAQRDAIHLAVAPVIACERLYPGQEIGFADPADITRVSAKAETMLGIVDPFLKRPVQVDERFWMFLLPQTITSLRHDWTHPAFDAKDKTIEKHHAEAWLREFANSARLTFEEVLAAAKAWIESGDYFTQHDCESARDAMCAATPQVFWRNYAAYTGQPVEDDEGQVFTCSC